MHTYCYGTSDVQQEAAHISNSRCGHLKLSTLQSTSQDKREIKGEKEPFPKNVNAKDHRTRKHERASLALHGHCAILSHCTGLTDAQVVCNAIPRISGAVCAVTVSCFMLEAKLHLVHFELAR